MIKLNRTTEYALLALRYMDKKSMTSPGEVSTAREISDHFSLPFEITAKTLQKMKEMKLIVSTSGAKGGYMIREELVKEIKFNNFLELMEGKNTLVQCIGNHDGCEYSKKCDLMGVMNKLHEKVDHVLSEVQLKEILL